jgi:ABC-type transporter Mla MlaB component
VADTLIIRGPITRADLGGLSNRVCQLFARLPGTTVLCDVAGVPADAVSVEALARLQLVARQNGCVVRLRSARRELLDLVAFLGLEDVLPE